MPFQDIDEVTTSEPRRQPGMLEKIVHKLFVEDWSLKLLSLAITLVLWIVVTGQNEPVTAHVNVQLNFIRPQSLEISNDPPKTVDVLLTGSRSKLDNLSSLDFVATVDISDQKAGERILRLADKAQITLPQGVRIDGFQPSSIPIRLEAIIERQIPIEAKLEGKPADGFEVYGVRLSNSTVTIRGPQGRVNGIERAQTETIWLTGHKETFISSDIALDITDPKVDLQDPVLNVEVVIGEKRVERTFANVSVTNSQGDKMDPATATVLVLGATSVLDKLKSSDLQILVEADGSTILLRVGQGLQESVTMKSVQPSRFSKANQ